MRNLDGSGIDVPVIVNLRTARRYCGMGRKVVAPQGRDMTAVAAISRENCGRNTGSRGIGRERDRARGCVR